MKTKTRKLKWKIFWNISDLKVLWTSAVKKVGSLAMISETDGFFYTQCLLLDDYYWTVAGLFFLAWLDSSVLENKYFPDDFWLRWQNLLVLAYCIAIWKWLYLVLCGPLTKHAGSLACSMIQIMSSLASINSIPFFLSNQTSTYNRNWMAWLAHPVQCKCCM